MRAIAVDTNTSAGFKRGDAACVEVMRHADQLLLSGTVLGELLAGFACGTQEARNREELSRFLASPRVSVCTNGLEHGALLFSFDPHFERIAGLRVIRSWAEALP